MFAATKILGRTALRGEGVTLAANSCDEAINASTGQARGVEAISHRSL